MIVMKVIRVMTVMKVINVDDDDIQGVFFLHWYPPKKYGKPRLGESLLT